jgi:hypothetical protein
LNLTGEAGSASKEAGVCSPKQMFNARESGLLWKSVMIVSLITLDEKLAFGFKTSKDKMTVLFCSNTGGDCKMRPLLIYHNKNPRAGY